jgi:hypothetical protein
MLVESSLLLFPLLFPIYSLEHTKMDIYFFQPERYERMYNCNLYSVDQIPLEQRQHVGLGLTWIGLTTISQVNPNPSIIVLQFTQFPVSLCAVYVLHL